MANENPHGSRQLNGYICLFVTFAAATVTICARLLARRLTRVQLWYDDYVAIIAYLCAVVWSGLMLWWLQIGLGLYLEEIDIAEDVVLERSRLILWNIELFYAFSLAFSKLAILAFYWRMFKTSKIKTPIMVLTGCAIVWLILRTFLAIFHCVPVQKFWKVELEGVCAIDDSKFFFGTVLTHLVIDVSILALPIIELYRLKLPLTQRLGVMAMFLFGIFVCVASVVVLVYSIQYDTLSKEMPWNIAPIIIWANVEVNLAIVSACLPMLRPIYLLILRRPLTKSSSAGSHFQSPGRSYSAHKLTNMTVTKTAEFDESDSTRQLAATSGARDGSISSSLDYNGQQGDDKDRKGKEREEHGMTTVVVGSADDKKLGARRGSKVGEGWGQGILVTNEMSVRVSKVA
ncbi:hypothetical protein EJ04DRAFT_437201 [Polyplosphaeria fusca]|uniref:Rhodopsin domain-containing protein n=1 Tax=Polyplosphaeria fusca TaxID=682080 RepID=A0A9P4QXB3_9PLEO|nr:hypothetical protein EJ04DRAFT_437201 [Polyplosphaeria fusca]